MVALFNFQSNFWKRPISLWGRMVEFASLMRYLCFSVNLLTMKMPSLAPVSIFTDCAGCQPSFVSNIIKEERERSILFSDTVSFWDCSDGGRMTWIWSTEGLILTGENWSTRTLSNSCHSATSSTTNPTWTGLGSILGLHSGRLVSSCFSHCVT